jgi:uncharacterized membrane protein
MSYSREEESTVVSIPNSSSNETTPLIAKQHQQQQQQQHNRKRELLGLLYMTLSALGFSTMSLFVKLSGSSFPSFEIVFARSIVQAVLGLLICIVLKIDPLGNKNIRGWLFLRGFAGTVGLSLFYFSITQLPLADATGYDSHIYYFFNLSTFLCSCLFLGTIIYCYFSCHCSRRSLYAV